MIELSALLVEKNRAFTRALKEKQAKEELKIIHGEIQEIYNQIASIKYAANYLH